MLLTATGILALVMVGSGALRIPVEPAPSPASAPAAIAASFEPAFEYSIPADSVLRASTGVRWGNHLVAWEGPDLPVAQSRYGGQDPDTGNLHGIMVASVSHPWSHSPGGRFTLRTDPAEFLADVRYQARVAMGAVSNTTLGGRPALTVTITATEYNDIHVSGLREEYVLIGLPSRLIVSDVDGTTVFVLIWARNAEDLAAWTPVADQFVASIHFLPKT